MFLGKRFRLIRSTTGLQLVDGTAKVVTIPLDGVIKVLSGPHGSSLHDKGLAHLLSHNDKGLVYAQWEDRVVALFAVDVQARGVEIKEPESESQPQKSARA